MRFGAHVSIEGSFAEAARRAVALRCDCFQIFAGPPRTYARSMPASHDVAEFRSVVEAHGLRPVVVHAGYLLHLISAKPETAKASREIYARELAVASALGAEYYVLHPGSAAGRPHEELLDELAAAMLAADAGGTTVLMENSATTNSGIGARFEEIGLLLDRLGDPRRFGMAFDTAHATGAGYDLSTAPAVAESLRALFAAVGPESVRVVHANDSKGELGSNRDLHHHIGRGTVGRSGFAALFDDPAMKDLPFIIETPVDRPGDDKRNLAALRRLAGRAPTAPRRGRTGTLRDHG
jgi:deoxyribonuclease-4